MTDDANDGRGPMGKPTQFSDPMRDVRKALESMRRPIDPMKQVREALRPPKFSDPTRDVRKMLESMRSRDPLKGFREALAGVQAQGLLQGDGAMISARAEPLGELWGEVRALGAAGPQILEVVKGDASVEQAEALAGFLGIFANADELAMPGLAANALKQHQGALSEDPTAFASQEASGAPGRTMAAQVVTGATLGASILVLLCALAGVLYALAQHDYEEAFKLAALVTGALGVTHRAAQDVPEVSGNTK